MRAESFVLITLSDFRPSIQKHYRVPRKKALGLWECPIKNLIK